MSAHHRQPSAPRVRTRSVVGGAAMTAVFLGGGAGMAFASPGDTTPNRDTPNPTSLVNVGGVLQGGVGNKNTNSNNNRGTGGGGALLDVGGIGQGGVLNQNTNSNNNSGRRGGGLINVGGIGQGGLLNHNHNSNNNGPGRHDHGTDCGCRPAPPKPKHDDCFDGWHKDGKGDWRDPHHRGDHDRDGWKRDDHRHSWCDDHKKPSHDCGCKDDHDKDKDKSDDTSDKKSDTSSPDKVESASTPDTSSDKVEAASTPDTTSNSQVSEVPSGSADTGDGSSQQPVLTAGSSGLGGEIALGGAVAAAALLGAYGVQMGRHRRAGSHRSR